MDKRGNGHAWAFDQAVDLLISSRYVIAMTGAGVSVESGIPPFRGPGGLWTKHGEPPMDVYQRFLADPKGYWEDMNMWPWEHYEMIHLAAACERADEFDVIQYQAAFYPMSLAFSRRSAASAGRTRRFSTYRLKRSRSQKGRRNITAPRVK